MKNVPNILTFLRLCLIPLYFFIFYSGREDAVQLAIFIFVLASLTDVLDGYLARKYKVVSTFGKAADPVADKLMQLSAIYTLADTGYIENWFFYVFLLKEIAQIVIGALLLLTRTKLVVQANSFGKATTVLVFITIVLSIFDFPGIVYLQALVMAFALFTLFNYAYDIVKFFMKKTKQ